MRQFIDKYLSFAISKKLLVFLISCFALFLGKIESEHFMIISSVYVGSQGFIDIVKEYYKK